MGPGVYKIALTLKDFGKLFAVSAVKLIIIIIKTFYAIPFRVCKIGRVNGVKI